MKISRCLMALFVLSFVAAGVQATEVPTDSSPMVAKVGDQVLTEGQMRNDLAFALYESELAVYQLKRSWAEEKARNIVFDNAAKEAKLSRKEWEKREIEAKLAAPAESDIAQMIQNISRGQPQTDPAKLQAMRNQALQYLTGQRRQVQENLVYSQLTQKYPVQLALLPPAQPNIQVTYPKNSPVKGPKNAPVTIIEFTDFECPWCARAQEQLKAVEKTYEGKVKIVTRHFPLQMHAQAMPAAKAAVCAQEQGKFWPMHDLLFKNQQALGDADLQKYAKEIGLNPGKFNKCIASEKADTVIREDMADATRYGVRGTPTFFVNGQRANFNQLSDFVKAELEKKK